MSMEQFDALLGELDTMMKALGTDDSADDTKIQEMADAQGEDEDEGEDECEGCDEDGTLGKSFNVTMADGSVYRMHDGTELVKALQSQVEDLTAQNDKTMDAFQSSVALIKSLQADVQTLQKSVGELGNQGRGRKAVLSVHDKPASGVLAKSETSSADILTKALAAQQAGRVSSLEVSQIEAYAGRGIEIPSNLLNKIGV